MKNLLTALCLFVTCLSALAQAPAKRSLKPSDVYLLKNIGSPQISPDGKWVLYTLSTVDTTKDRRNSDIWMTSWDGEEHVQLTFTEEGESNPKWSPDGKYISFVSARNGEKVSQLWLMDTRGGEAKKATKLKGDLDSYVWSPDGKRIAMAIGDQVFLILLNQKNGCLM